MPTDLVAALRGEDGDLFVKEAADMIERLMAAAPLAVPAGFALVPVERSYDMRAAAIPHFNTARQAGRDLDDALDAAWQATLAKAHHPADPLGLAPLAQQFNEAPAEALRPEQSAPAREREAFEHMVRFNWASAPLHYIRDALPKDDPRYGQYVDESLQSMWVGWQGRAAWVARQEQQAEPLHITHRPLIRNAIGLLSMRRPMAPDVERVVDALSAMLDGLPTPTSTASDAWLRVAELAETPVPHQPT